MKLGDIQGQGGLIQPSEKGITVFLAGLPEYTEAVSSNGNAYAKINFSFRDADGNEFNTGMLDPFKFDMSRYEKGAKLLQANRKDKSEDAKYANMINGNFSRLKHIFGCFMTDANYKKLDDIDVNGAKDFLEVCEQLYASDLLEMEFQIMIGYSVKTGYIDFPAYGNVISSKYKTRELSPLDPSYNRLTRPDKSPDGERPAARTNTNLI